jgi:hypothetical protein
MHPPRASPAASVFHLPTLKISDSCKMRVSTPTALTALTTRKSYAIATYRPLICR